MEDSATSSSMTSIWASLNSWFTSTVFFILLNLMIATILFTSNLPTNNNNHHQHKQQEEEQQQQQEEQKQNSQNENHHNHNNNQNQPKMARSPSIIHRLKSFNFYPQRPEQEFSSETYHHLQALEVAATQYVFNQPLHYEHFDLDPTPSGLEQNRVVWEELGQQEEETVADYHRFDPELVGRVGSSSNPTHQRIRRDPDPEHAHDEEEKEVEEEESDEFQSLDEVYSQLKGGNVDRSKSDGDLRRKPQAKMKKSASLKVGFSHLEEEETVEARRPETMRERSAARVAAAAAEDDGDDVEVDSKAADFINKFKNDLILQRIESIAARSK